MKLSRLSPGASGTVRAVRCRDGSICTDAGGIAGELRSYWAGVFRSGGFDEATLRGWIAAELETRPPEQDHGAAIGAARLRRSHIRRAVKMGNRSCPGPDGIPYSAFKVLGVTAIDIL